MKRWTAALAIFAYVLGGWLLPAAHHHEHGCGHISVQTATAGQCHGHHHGCHLHAHEADSAAGLILVDVDDVHRAGLCALCLARSLAKPSGGHASLMASEDRCHVVSADATRLLIDTARRANQTRGPPVARSVALF